MRSDGESAGRRSGGAGDFGPSGVQPNGVQSGGVVPGARSTGPLRPHVDPADRARQFLPFAALRGYYDLVRKQERVVEPRHELTEEEALCLSACVAGLHKGDLVRVVYYDTDAYVTVTGMLAAVDATFRTLTVVKTKIAFDDIRSVERVAEGG